MTAIFCIGAAHWDMIGHSPARLDPGADVPGRICRAPGGVALNIARGLAAHGLRPVLITVLGRDAAGRELKALLQAEGIDTAHLHWSDSCATDSYMAIEGANGLIGAIADSRALESLPSAALAPVQGVTRPLVILDSGLVPGVLAELAHAPLLAGADLRLAAASPAKAAALRPFLGRPGTCFHVNRAEAAEICGTDFPNSHTAAQALVGLGAARACVTDGPNPVSDADAATTIIHTPPTTTPQRVTGAGDCFTAAHIAAELQGLSRDAALRAALDAARAHIATPAPN